MDLNFLGYFTIAKNTLEKYPRKFKYALYGAVKAMYLNFSGYFTIAKNTLEKYPGKFV